MTFTLFDLVNFIIISGSSVLGVYNGIVKLSIKLLGFIASIFIAYLILPLVEEVLVEHISNNLWLSVSSGITSYIKALIVSGIVTSRIIKVVHEITGGMVDRFLGFLAGFLRGGLISVVIFTITAIITSNSYLHSDNASEVFDKISTENFPKWLSNSRLMPYLDNASKNIISYIPQESLRSITLANIKLKTDTMDDIVKKAVQHENTIDSKPSLDSDLSRELEDLK